MRTRQYLTKVDTLRDVWVKFIKGQTYPPLLESRVKVGQTNMHYAMSLY
jgi:hypothetical protein